MKSGHPVYTAACVLLISVFTGAVLFLAASNKAIWVDEAYSLAPVKQSLRTIWACEQMDVHPPLFFFMERCWYLLFGDGIFAMKCLSILPMVLTMIFAAWFLIKECSGKAAVLFLLCCIASETIVHYSIEIRMYSWAFLFVTMAALCAWFIIKTGKTILWAGLRRCVSLGYSALCCTVFWGGKTKRSKSALLLAACVVLSSLLL
jgi:uncharacterized membrane protein